MNSTETMTQIEAENTESNNANSHDSPMNTSNSHTQSVSQVAVSNKNPKNNLFKVKRQAHYIDIFLKNIVPEEVFFIAGDFTVDKQVFQNIQNNKLVPYCPLIKYRPHIQVEMGKNYIFSIVDGTQSGSIEIEGAINMLKKLQKQKAMDLSQMIEEYRESLARTEEIVQRVQKIILKPEVRLLIQENHEQSKKIARQRMEEADKNKIYLFLYGKFDVETCTNKFHFVGGNSKFSEVFTGINDMNLMRHYIQRYGFPAYNDCNGNVNVLFSKFLMQNTYEAYLGTYDEEMLPFTAIRNFIPLHQFEISPGIYVGDKFEIRELKIADTILQQLQQVRKNTNSIETYLRIDDLAYSLEAEAFISKFYKKSEKKTKK